jgi:hypothetical protein
MQVLVGVGAALEVESTVATHCPCVDPGVAPKAVALGERVAARCQEEALCILLCHLLPLLHLASGVQGGGGHILRAPPPRSSSR